MKHVLRHLRRAALLSVEEGPSDAQLLESFLVRRDEVAFEALLRRHGPMVLGVCQRVLRNVHDAEDALQATFLVLARKASSIRSRQVVASWLYGVAYRTAMKARVMKAKRRTKERQAGQMTRSQSSSDEELLEQLDHELSRLPDKYRVPVILCELEGRSRRDVARLLGVPEGTLSWRLAQAKKMLAKRLSRHELAIPLGVLAVGMSPSLRASTLKTALTTGAAPAIVLALTEGVMKAMLLTKLKIVICVTALALVAGVGATGLTYRAMAEQPTPAIRPQADELEALRLEIEALRKSLQATRERVKTLESEVSALKGQRHGLQEELQEALGKAPVLAISPAWVDEEIDNSPTVVRLLAEAEKHKDVMKKIHDSWNNPELHPKYQESDQKLKKVEAELAAERKRLRPRILLQLQEKMYGQGVGSSRGAGGQPPRGGGMMGMKMGTMPRMPGSPDTGQSVAGMMQKETKPDPVTDAENALKKLRENPGDKQATEALERALKRLKERDKQNQPGETPRK